MTGLASSRSAAVAAEGTALRRLERDIHDGPQQRLVRLQMDLAAADRQLDKDPKAARALLEEALQQSKDALDELRALSRGFAPPILMDRGLVAALESLAVRAAVPTTVVDELPEGIELPAELERNAYFIAAEALTNAAKHAKAKTATVTISVTTAAATRPQPGCRRHRRRQGRRRGDRRPRYRRPRGARARPRRHPRCHQPRRWAHRGHRAPSIHRSQAE